MSAKKEERAKVILGLLAEKKRMEVASLSALLGVSQVTVRKDLDDLESQGLIRRAHGAAELNSPDNIHGRLARHYEEKRRIAALAAGLVEDGDTVLIESGSCCALLAALLAETRQGVTVVTNSAFIADYIRRGGVQPVLLGGLYQGGSQCVVGPMVRECAASFHVRHFFAGTDGWSASLGFTNKDQLRAQAVRDMAEAAEEVVVLTESEKFSAPGTVPLRVDDRIRTVITDSGIPAEAAQWLRARGTQILLAGE